MSVFTPEEQQVLYLIKSDNDHARYFWSRAKNLKWFYSLRDNDYFCPKQIELDDNYNTLFWNVLDYLERVSEQVKDYQEYGKELLNIINDTVSYSNQLLSDGKKGINNYHIWWYFVKIIHNLPPKIIIENLPINDWQENDKVHFGFRSLLLAMTDTSLGSNWDITDITRKLLPKFLEDAYPAEYAETILDVITRIKEGAKTTSLSDRNEVVIAWDAYWLLDAFEKNHEKIAKKCSSKVVFKIADRLKNALSYKQRRYAVPIKKNDHV